MLFSKDFLNVVEKAKGLAIKYNRPNVCVDTLLHSLFLLKNSSLEYILASLNVNKFDMLIISEIEMVRKTPSVKPSGMLSKNVKLVIEDAEAISKDFGEDYVAVESLLMAILKLNKKSSVFKILDFDTNVSGLLEKRVEEFFKDSIPKFKREKEKKEDEESDRFLDMFAENKILDEFGTNLNLKASKGDFDNLVNHDPDKVNEIAVSLLRKRKANVILVGGAGQGKTSYVEMLAKMIVDAESPEMLFDKVIYSVDLSRMVAGTEFRGMFEKRLTQFVEEAKKYDNLILFFDEIHALVGAGGSGRKNDLEASNILKPPLANGELSVIGATTQEEYEAKIKGDSALDRRFNKIVISEPSKFKMKEILPRLAEYYEMAHGVVFSPEFLDSLVEKCEKYLPNKRYPDKAIDILDAVGAQAKMKIGATPEYVKKAQDGLIDVSEKLAKGDLSNQDEITRKLEDVKIACERWEQEYINHSNVVEELELESFFEKRKRIILRKCFNGISEFFPNEKKGLSEKIIETIKKESGTILFYGEKNSGKTTLCKAFSDFARKNEVDVIHFSGLDFNVGELCRRVMNSDSAVVIIDDLSSINSDISTFLIKILKDKKIERSSGEVIDFSNVDFILTCESKKGSLVGFDKDKSGLSPNLNEDLVKCIKNSYELENFTVEV